MRRGRRRWPAVAAVAVALLVAGSVAVVVRGTGDDGPSPAASDPDGPILVGDWTPGQGGDDAEVIGRVALDRRGCVVLQSAQGTSVPVWPEGWTAVEDDDGVVFRGPDGTEVRPGQYVEAGGGYGRSPELRRWRCHPDRGEVARIQSEVEVVDPVPVLIPLSDWRPGDPAYTARLAGRLTHDDGCVRIGGTTPIWPAGWMAELDPRGALAVLDADGDPVAREGDLVEVGGAGDPRRGPTGCPGAFQVQSGVRVERG